MSSIEWPTDVPNATDFTVSIPDNWPAPAAGPAEILVASLPAEVKISFDVGSHAMTLGGRFELKAYAESVGPGLEVMLGNVTVPVVGGQRNYTASIPIPGSTLLGEGQTDSAGNTVSGVYKIIVVLQHMNPGPTFVGGFAEESLRMFLSP